MTINDPGGVVKKIVQMALLLLAILVLPAKWQGCQQNRAERREEARLLREIAVARAILNRPPAPIAMVHEFVLKPGESRTIETYRQPFKYRFYDTTAVDLFRGRYAFERVLFRRGSYEYSISTRNSRYRGIERIRIVRPESESTPLGYWIETQKPVAATEMARNQ